jgi:hypothetical protein
MTVDGARQFLATGGKKASQFPGRVVVRIDWRQVLSDRKAFQTIGAPQAGRSKWMQAAFSPGRA